MQGKAAHPPPLPLSHLIIDDRDPGTFTSFFHGDARTTDARLNSRSPNATSGRQREGERERAE